jgi:hypothetical protein
MDDTSTETNTAETGAVIPGIDLTSLPVTAPVIASQPDTPPVSDSIDKTATSSLLGTMQQTVATDPNLALAASTGSTVVNDENGVPQLVIGQYGQTPDQLEAAGILKPGSAQLVNSSIASGMDVDTAMPPNLFTGEQGITSLDSYINNPTAQASVSVTALQQSQTQLTNAGVITGQEDPSQISGVVLSGATVGVPQTISAINSINCQNPNVQYDQGMVTQIPPAGYGVSSSSPLSSVGGSINSFASRGISGVSAQLGGSFGSVAGSISGSFNSLSGGSISASFGSISGVSGRIMGTISKGNFAAGAGSLSVGSLGGLSLSLSALSNVPSLSSLTVSVKGASASAFYAIAASFRPMQAGVPQNLTVLAKQAASRTAGAASIGGSLSLSNGLKSLTGSISGSLSGSIGGVPGSISLSGGLNSIGGIRSIGGSISGAIGGVSGSIGGIATNSSLSSLGTSTSAISGALAIQGVIGSSSARSSRAAPGALPSTGIGGFIQKTVNQSTNNLRPTVGGYASTSALLSSTNAGSTGLYQAALSVSSGSLHVSAAAMASGVNNLPGGSGSISSVVNNSSKSLMSVPGISSISSLAKKTSSSLLNNILPSNPFSTSNLGSSLSGGLGGVESITSGDPLVDASNLGTPDLNANLPDISDIDAASGDLTGLASSGLSAGDAAQLEASVSALSTGGPSPVKMPTVAMNTVDRSDLVAGINDQLGDPSIPPPNFLDDVSPVAIDELDQVQQQEADATQAVNKIDTYNIQVDAAYQNYYLALQNYPQGDPRIEQAHQEFLSLQNSPELAQLYKQANI